MSCIYKYIYIYLRIRLSVCAYLYAQNICIDRLMGLMGNSLAPVNIAWLSLDKYGGRKCLYQSYHRNLEAWSWSFLLPFQKVTNKKLTEIPSSIQKNHHPTAQFEAVFVFLVPIFFSRSRGWKFPGSHTPSSRLFWDPIPQLSVGVKRMG